ncbi:chemotaxis protein CheR [Sphingomonas sp. Leaf33]|uniref:CheR family methyltransferase n=1 Tax=Sphingomonas sp. Leaf33 TaxID=1736215 RepID=UPI0006FE8FB9|nr:protein-glutamate O-methyltransferase CheR [Sphingomonas sp. Leaf33]KQN25956.1 chemotaxis protein CheR [Sphingomonas sp. Leaf33]
MIAPRSAPVRGAGNPAAAIATIFEQRTGQLLGEQRLWRVDSALNPLLRDLKLATLDQLAVRLKSGAEPMLTQKVVDALLNQESSFFRDPATIDMVVDAIVAMHDAAPGRRLRIWSAGCATGQEPLSLAIRLDERGIDPAGYDIVATDVSVESIARARAGTYTHFEIQRGLSMGRMIAWFDGDDTTWTARPELVRRIQYRTHNLVYDTPPAGVFDVILCRNVMLYFSAEVRRRLLDTLADSLRPSGLLVMGAGETTLGQTDRFDPSQAWRGAYVRTDRPH